MVRDSISLLLLASVPFVLVAASRDAVVQTCSAQEWRDGTCAQFMGGNNMLQVTRQAQQTRRRRRRKDEEAEDEEAGGVAGGGVSEFLMYDMDIDVAYGKEKEHRFDVYWPANLEMPALGWPTVIIMHGKGGGKSGYKGFCTNYIVQSGRLCVAGSYRIDDKYRTDDIYEMFMWVRKKAPKWNVDTMNIVLGGFSLGSLTINNIIWDKNMGKDLLSGSPPKVKAVMLLSGCWNHARSAKKAEYFPSSTFIMSSNTDAVVPHKDSKDLYKQLDELGQNVHFVVIEDAGHNIMYSDKADDWYAEILQWLDMTIPGRK